MAIKHSKLQAPGMQQVQRQSVRPIRFLALELMTQAASNFYNLLIRRHH